MRIALQLQGIFSVFNTCWLNENEVVEALEYDIIFITPDADIWSPNCDAWAEQEDEMLGIRCAKLIQLFGQGTEII